MELFGRQRITKIIINHGACARYSIAYFIDRLQLLFPLVSLLIDLDWHWDRLILVD